MRTLTLIALMAAMPAWACPTSTMKSIVVEDDQFIPDLGTISSRQAVFDEHPSYLEIVDLAVGIEIEHTWPGDLTVTLMYTPPDNPFNVTSRLWDRPDAGQCGIPLVWDGHEYQFQDGFSEWDCGDGPGGCYEAADQHLDDFYGIQGSDGGAFWILIEDQAIGDVGRFHGFTLYLTMGPIISVDANTWGQVKARYRTEAP